MYYIAKDDENGQIRTHIQKLFTWFDEANIEIGKWKTQCRCCVLRFVCFQLYKKRNCFLA